MKTNEGYLDRIIRVTVGTLATVAGLFWLAGWGQIVAIIFGVVGIVTGLVGFCGIYKLLKITTCNRNEKPIGIKQFLILVLIMVGIGLLGSLASIKITKNKFLEDYGRMNDYYKQTLFLTGQNKRDEAIKNYELWTIGFDDFASKYSQYRPYVLKKDNQFASDLAKVEMILNESKTGVYEGDLVATHQKLEEVRPIFQDIFKRNGFSMLAITLTDFHDSMEKLIEASDNQQSDKVISGYEETSGILTQIESGLNDDDIKSIRQNLDALYNLAKENKSEELAKKAGELKSSFVKVYLTKG